MQKPKTIPKRPIRKLPTEAGTVFQPWWDTTGTTPASEARFSAKHGTSSKESEYTTIYRGDDYTIIQRKDGRFVVFEPGQEITVLPEGMTLAEVERTYIDPQPAFSRHRRSFP